MLTSFFKDFIYLFLDRGKGRENKRERNINVWLPFTQPILGTWPATQACVVTGNRTSNPLVLRPALNPLSHPSQGMLTFLYRCAPFQQMGVTQDTLKLALWVLVVKEQKPFPHFGNGKNEHDADSKKRQGNLQLFVQHHKQKKYMKLSSQKELIDCCVL